MIAPALAGRGEGLTPRAAQKPGDRQPFSRQRRDAPLTYAQNLRGRLLIVHGTGDDNVHFQNTEAMINALVAETGRSR